MLRQFATRLALREGGYMYHILKKDWRNKKVLTGMTLLLVIATACISILLSLMIARNQAISQETSRLHEITSDVLARMHMSREQHANIVRYFAAVADSDACLPENIRKMQEFNVSSPFLQAVAHVRDQRIACSSTSEIFDNLNLGSPYRIEPDGTRFWNHITVPNWPNRLVLMEKAGWAIMFVPAHVLEALGNAEVAVGVFNIQSLAIYTARGEIFPEWLEKYQGKQALTFVDDQRRMLVHIAPNHVGLTGVVAAAPLQQVNDVMTFIQILIPLATVVSLLLGGLFFYVRKTRYSPKFAILRALANHEFYMEYQPVINLHHNQCVGAEALVRWRTSDNTFISPELFIPAAEASGVICQITQRVFELVAKDMRHVFSQYPDFHVGINISSHDIRSGALLSLIQAFKESSGAHDHQILIEVTERGFLDDEEGLTAIRKIRECGVRVAIDDFGTGYSSLSYLTKFQLDYLKIDKTFIDSVGTDAVTSHVAFHIIEMAKTLKLDMVAEGVETAEQAKILQERGVHHVQGWLFSKSLKVNEFYRYLANHAPPAP